ncbi:Ycf34 family protein [Thermoleptolyngbya sp.]
MCICVNCHYVDRCTTYHAVEHQHQQPHLTEFPDFEAIEPTINVNIRQGDAEDIIEMEWDVVGCVSFVEEMGKWAKLRPGELVPT